MTVPVLNESGQTAFIGMSNTNGIWSEGSGSLSLVAKMGGSAPGISGATFSSLGANSHDYFNLNDVGTFAFAATVSTPGSSTPSRGIWEQNSGGLSLLFHENDTTLQGTNEKLSLAGEIQALALNDSDVVSFLGQSDTDQKDVRVNVSPTNSRAIARGALNAFDTVARPLNGNSLIAFGDATSISG